MSQDSFLPADYQAPAASSGKYTKFETGETRLRILSNPAFGYEYWNTSNKPVRLKDQPKGKPADMRLTDTKGREERVKHFWALKVYNYNTGQMEVCQIAQATLQNRIAELSRDKDWGNPKAYDVKILKTVVGDKTTYSVNPVPHQPVTEDVKAAFMATPIDLEALFIPGADVFSNTAPQQAPSAVGAAAPAPAAAPATTPAPPVAAPAAAQSNAGRPVVLDEGDLPF
ncbi:hypothetical protein [Rufibacter soli]